MGLTQEAIEHVRRVYRPSFDGDHASKVCAPVEPSEVPNYTPQNVRISADERKTFAEYPCQLLSLRERCSFRAATAALRTAIANASPSQGIAVGYCCDLLTQGVLTLLGHRWPKQLEAGGTIPDCADKDGIIPLTSMANEPLLFERIQKWLRADGIETVEFSEVMGKSLHDWLATEFFKHHGQQFRKRPIAWQLQSDKFKMRAAPAFACVLYYHKLDVDMLPKLRSQYVGPLRQRLETEQRGILGVAVETRSERQEKRRAELEDAVLELQRFDAVLESFARAGFGPQSLLPALRQNAIDDAMLALKVRWLRRLTELIEKGPLRDWLDAADRTDLHPELRTWIADAMAHLDYFCARVGPKPPDEDKLKVDTTTADLAKLIAPQANAILKGVLVLACNKWFAHFDETVLGPDKDKSKELRQEQKSCEEQIDRLEAEPIPPVVEIRDLKYRVKEIKQEVKALTAKIKRKTALATKVRTEIERWQSKEHNDRRVHRPGVTVRPRHQ
jgi:hypothetical protein